MLRARSDAVASSARSNPGSRLRSAISKPGCPSTGSGWTSTAAACRPSSFSQGASRAVGRSRAIRLASWQRLPSELRLSGRPLTRGTVPPASATISISESRVIAIIRPEAPSSRSPRSAIRRSSHSSDPEAALILQLPEPYAARPRGISSILDYDVRAAPSPAPAARTLRPPRNPGAGQRSAAAPRRVASSRSGDRRGRRRADGRPPGAAPRMPRRASMLSGTSRAQSACRRSSRRR